MRKLLLVGLLLGAWGGASVPEAVAQSGNYQTRTVTRKTSGGQQGQAGATNSVRQNGTDASAQSGQAATCIFLNQQSEMVYVTGAVTGKDKVLLPTSAMVYRNGTWAAYELAADPFHDLAFCGGYLANAQGKAAWYPCDANQWASKQFRIKERKYGNAAPIVNGVPKTL